MEEFWSLHDQYTFWQFLFVPQEMAQKVFKSSRKQSVLLAPGALIKTAPTKVDARFYKVRRGGFEPP